MLKELKKILKKYQQIAKYSQYVNVEGVINDYSCLIRECQIKRLPKNER